MKGKIKLIVLTSVLFGVNSCNKCDHSKCAKEVIKERTIIQLPTEFSERPKNIILMVGDGMGVSQIYAGLTRNKGFLNLQRVRHIGFSKTNSADNYITDSAAGATAFSIGKKTFNNAIGVDKDTIPQKTILEIAEERGKATGLVSTSSITHATPASFIAHQPHRKMYEEIALDFLKTDIDFFVGGGRAFFENRKDGKNLSTDLKAKGYNLVYKIEELEKFKGQKIAGLLADDGMPKMSEGRGNMLEKASLAALNTLSQNESGFFLMIEGSQIDWGGHDNDSEYIIQEMVDFDEVIGKIMDFADKNKETLIIITADHETGGYSINGGSLETGEVQGVFNTDHHTASMVPVFAYGPGAEAFMGMYENNTIFDKMMSLYGFTKK